MTADAADSTEANVSYGILADGTRFPVPDTMSVVAALISPKSWRSPATLIWIVSWVAIGLTGALYYTGVLPVWFFCAQFAFWRLAYNVGIGYLLHRQSNSKHFLNMYKRLIREYPTLAGFMESSIVFEDNSTYTVSNFPDEFNAWMLFRQIENVILANDLVSYVVLSFVCWESMSIFSPVDIVCFLIGGLSVAFALWSKSDAHRVIGDFAWYWGDFFFLLDKNLTFDGIFQMFPHPMYTVGYAFMYGVPIMAKSYTLFYMSVFGHLCQLAFLAFVENPHIDRTYTQINECSEEERERKRILYGDGQNERGYLQPNELVVFLHFNGFRASDLLLALAVVYIFLSLLFPIPAWAYVVHYLCWRGFHNGFLGYLLHRQSESQWFSKNYESPRHAFNNWKRIYNASVTITNCAYALCAIKLFTWSVPLFGGGNARIFMTVVGALLAGVNAYVSLSIYETIGDYGYFYGDFFIRDVPRKLNYSGIYRYLNNPDTSLGMSAYYGAALISGSWVCLLLAFVSHVVTKTFEHLVEEPHMRKMYGPQIREAGGMQTELSKKLHSSRMEYERNMKKLKGVLNDRQYGAEVTAGESGHEEAKRE